LVQSEYPPYSNSLRNLSKQVSCTWVPLYVDLKHNRHNGGELRHLLHKG